MKRATQRRALKKSEMMIFYRLMVSAESHGHGTISVLPCSTDIEAVPTNAVGREPYSDQSSAGETLEPNWASSYILTDAIDEFF